MTLIRCDKCGKKRRKGLWLPPRFRRGSWTIRAGVPVIVDGTITEGEDCCCCLTCCDPGTSPPQLELDASGITMNPFIGCSAGCPDFADVFLLDFRSINTGTTPGGFAESVCVWRYCGELTCDDGVLDPEVTAFGWDVGIYSIGGSCKAIAIPWLGGDCDDFSAAGGTDADYSGNLPTDPDDCCDALSSPLTLNDPQLGSGSIGNRNVTLIGGCEIFNIASNDITIQAVGC
jgi:hypothetical protein